MQSACADLLLAREQVFDTFDHKPRDTLDHWTRSTGQQHQELDCVNPFQDDDAEFDLALDAAFASVA